MAATELRMTRAPEMRHIWLLITSGMHASNSAIDHKDRPLTKAESETIDLLMSYDESPKGDNLHAKSSLGRRSRPSIKGLDNRTVSPAEPCGRYTLEALGYENESLGSEEAVQPVLKKVEHLASKSEKKASDMEKEGKSPLKKKGKTGGSQDLREDQEDPEADYWKVNGAVSTASSLDNYENGEDKSDKDDNSFDDAIPAVPSLSDGDNSDDNGDSGDEEDTDTVRATPGLDEEDVEDYPSIFIEKQDAIPLINDDVSTKIDGTKGTLLMSDAVGAFDNNDNFEGALKSPAETYSDNMSADLAAAHPGGPIGNGARLKKDLGIAATILAGDGNWPIRLIYEHIMGRFSTEQLTAYLNYFMKPNLNYQEILRSILAQVYLENVAQVHVHVAEIYASQLGKTLFDTDRVLICSLVPNFDDIITPIKDLLAHTTI